MTFIVDRSVQLFKRVFGFHWQRDAPTAGSFVRLKIYIFGENERDESTKSERPPSIYCFVLFRRISSNITFQFQFNRCHHMVKGLDEIHPFFFCHCDIGNTCGPRTIRCVHYNGTLYANSCIWTVERKKIDISKIVRPHTQRIRSRITSHYLQNILILPSKTFICKVYDHPLSFTAHDAAVSLQSYIRKCFLCETEWSMSDLVRIW